MRILRIVSLNWECQCVRLFIWHYRMGWALIEVNRLKNIFQWLVDTAHLSFIISIGDSVACRRMNLWFLRSFTENERQTMPRVAAAVFVGTVSLVGWRSKHEVPHV